VKVHELMRHPAHTCAAHDSLETAARLLWEHDCGFLPVVDPEGRVVAAITDRDICMGAYTRGKRLADLSVGDSMSKTVVSCRADEDLVVAAQKMAEHGVRRLPVVDAKGHVRGILSLNDLAGALDEHTIAARHALRVLAGVGRHRGKDVASKLATAAPTVRQAPPNPQRGATLIASKVDGEC